MAALDELRSWVFDEHKPVTYRWLSNELSITSNDAKQLLYQFVNQQETKAAPDATPVAVTYVLAGAPKDALAQHRVQIVRGEHLEKAKASLASVTSLHVFSVQASEAAAKAGSERGGRAVV